MKTGLSGRRAFSNQFVLAILTQFNTVPLEDISKILPIIVFSCKRVLNFEGISFIIELL